MTARNKWIPVSERLPENDDLVLVWDGEMYALGDYVPSFVAEPWWVGGGDGFCVEKITHWMPLPEPPAGDPPMSEETRASVERGLEQAAKGEARVIGSFAAYAADDLEE